MFPCYILTWENSKPQPTCFSHKSQGFRLDAVVLSALVSSLERGLRWSFTLQVLRRSAPVGTLTPRGLTSSAAACAKQSEWTWALQLHASGRTLKKACFFFWKTMIPIQNMGLILMETCNTHLEYKICFRLNEVMKLIQKIRPCGCALLDPRIRPGGQPSVQSLTVSVTACEKASRWSSALELSKQSINSRVQVDFMAMNSILDYLGIFIIPSKKGNWLI